MRFNLRLFVVLLLAGLTGVVSLWLIDLNGLLSVLPTPPEAEIPTVTPALKILSMIQPSFLLAAAVFVGVALAHRVGLSSPVAEAVANGGDVLSALRPQILPGIVGGVVGGIAIVLIASAWKPFLPLEVSRLISDFGNFIPLPVRLLYGGITEELLLRWGLMTLLVWLGWRLLQKGQAVPSSAVFVGAIVVSSVVFAIGHLPIAFFLFPDASLALILFVIVGNSSFGLVAGYLYLKKGLESAMLAHALAHVVMLTASRFGAYF